MVLRHNLSHEHPAAADPHQEMAELLFGYWVSQILRAMVELSVADHLAGGATSADELADRAGSDPHSTRRLLRGGVTVGLLDTDEHGRFRSTPLLDTLRSDDPRSLSGLVLALTGDAHWLTWRRFSTAIRSGTEQVTATLGCEPFSYFAQHPEEGREFSGGMSAITSLWASALIELIDTSTVRCAVDVGGANGALLQRLQAANPALHGVVFDRPNIVADTAPAVAASGYADRTEVIGGDFFASVPAGDLYLLKFVLHDWDDEHCVQILRRCREAMQPGGRVAILEFVVGSDDDPGTAALMDLNMLAMTQGGRERTLAEFDALLAAAGLRRVTVLSTPESPQRVIEAVAV
jgi:hypothetical protein